MTEKEQAALAKKKYMKKWNAKNPDKVRQHQDRYWAKKYKEQLEEENKAK